jgi:hypothetical protein
VAWRISNMVMAVIFAASAALQHNDPDPVRWIALYLAASLCCVASGLGWPGARWLAAATALTALAWAAWLAPATLPGFEPRNLLRSMKAETPAIELGRELLGLLIVAGWTGLLALRPAISAWRERRSAPARS